MHEAFGGLGQRLALLALFGLNAQCIAAYAIEPPQATSAQPIEASNEVRPSADVQKMDAPNVVQITPQLTTSGQPSAAALAQLGKQGYAAVIYLAPPSVADAIADEEKILAAQGISYTNIPIQFYKPNEQDLARFFAAMSAATGKKVLVHCQVNMRASSMVFLYRVLVGKEEPQKAYEMVSKVWSPNRAWRHYIQDTLKKNQIAFEAF